MAAIEENQPHSSLTPVSKSTGLDRNVRINHPFYSQENKPKKFFGSEYSVAGEDASRSIQAHQKVYGVINSTFTHVAGS